ASIRDAALRPAITAVANAPAIRASVVATLDGSGPVHLWPTADVGQFRGSLRAPSSPGIYRLRVTGNGATTDVPLVVATDVRRATPSAGRLLDAWASARGGRAFSASEIDQLPSALTAAIRPAARLETWHPMRSAWWIAPFAFALSGEWWLRRRRGLR